MYSIYNSICLLRYLFTVIYFLYNYLLNSKLGKLQLSYII